MKLITGNANVRAAARDYERYSSDLQATRMFVTTSSFHLRLTRRCIRASVY